MWCNEGLECIIDVTGHEQTNILAALKGEPTKSLPLNHMVMRAKFNPQRHYEIYAFNSQIPEVSIREMFEGSPQVIVDAIRRIGVKVYSDRTTRKPVIT